MLAVAAKPRAPEAARTRMVAPGTARTAAIGGHYGVPAYLQHRVRDPAGSRSACGCGSASCKSCGGIGNTVPVPANDPWAGSPSPSRTAPGPGRTAGPGRSATAGVSGGGRWPLHAIFDRFAFDKSILTGEHWDRVDPLSHLLRALPSGAVTLEAIGHTDSTGTEVYNRGLSDRRADRIAEAIGLRVGTAVTRRGRGAGEPIASNATEDGRARNRRVDLQIWPGTMNWTLPVPKPVPDPTHTPVPDPPETEPFFCLISPLHFAICLGVVAGLGALVFEGLGILGGLLSGLLAGIIGGLGGILDGVRRIARCLRHPIRCALGDGDGGDDGPDDKPEEPPPDHACLAAGGVNLPDGQVFHATTPRHNGTRWVLDAPFNMELTFRDSEQEGCACYCGEYLQEVRGMFEVYDGTMWHHTPHPIRTDGTTLHATMFQEDGREVGGINAFYGHRYQSTGALGINGQYDRFEPLRQYGCIYLGYDAPGLNLDLYPGGERRRFSLEFRGTAVDACANRSHVGSWSHWRAYGEYVPQYGPPPPPPSQNRPPSNVITRRPPRIVGPQLATPLPAGLAIEIERQWQDDPNSLCLDNQVSCGAATYVDGLTRQGIRLTEDLRREAVARERAALGAHCDNLGRWAMESYLITLDEVAEKRLDNFLHWGEQVGDHALHYACPNT